MNTEENNSKTDTINVLTTILVILLAAIPTLEILMRFFFKTGITASYTIIRHIVLWVAFVGSYLASKTGSHLSIEAGKKYIPERFIAKVGLFSRVVEVSVLTGFLVSSVSFIFIAFASHEKTGIINTRILVSVIPLCFAAMVFYLFHDILKAGKKINPYTAVFAAVTALFFAVILSITPIVNLFHIQLADPPVFLDDIFDKAVIVISSFKLPAVIILIVSGMLGTPIFIVLGGITYILLSATGGYTEIAVNEIYTVLTGNMIPAIPLFTVTGFILSESKAGERMIEFFKKSFGWFPGGIIIATVLISAFFTTFTGASGVTILALGGILFMILEKYGVSTKFSTGILTSSGSVGLLFPPSLPIILYGITSNQDIKSLFIAGIFPGFLLVVSLSIAGIFYTRKHDIKREKINIAEFFSSIKNCFWELLLPFIILASYFSGLTTIVETGAVAVIYVLVIETMVYREIPQKGLVNVFRKSVPVIGGIFIIIVM